MSKNDYKVDVLVFGPHPDDAEIGVGGLLLSMHAAGRTSAIVDMTEGESASTGTVDIRYSEAEEARKILGVKYRENLKLPDCGVEDNIDSRKLAAEMIRKYRPSVIISPFFRADPPGRGRTHADHYNTGMIVSNAYNYSHLKNLPLKGEPWQATSIFYYMLPLTITPTFVVDFTAFFDRYLSAIKAHKSQFGPWFDRLSGEKGLHPFELRSAFMGINYSNGGYAQGFYSPNPLQISDPMVIIEGQVSLVQKVDTQRNLFLQNNKLDQ